jgi:hypothetical protein
MGFDNKYGRVTTENGYIPDDEPVVVIRAQDRTTIALLEYYLKLCKEAGSPEKHLDLIEFTTENFKQWQALHATQVPQSKGYNVQS